MHLVTLADRGGPLLSTGETAHSGLGRVLGLTVTSRFSGGSAAIAPDSPQG